MRVLEQLNIRCVDHLCKHLHCTQQELADFRQHPDRWYERRVMTDKNGKSRPIAVPKGRFYAVSKNLHKLISRIALPPYLHGGVKGHSPRTNAILHIGEAAILKFDIADFFPHITPRQVYSVFHDRLACSAEVAAILIRLTTLDRGLPQGSPTSTAVANLVIVPLAARLSELAISHESNYSQFVDDGAISGPGYLENLRPLVEKIIQQEGFHASLKPHKRLTLYRNQEQVVTGVRVNSRISVPNAKIREVSHLLDAAEEQVAVGADLTDGQMRSLAGKIQHIQSLDLVLGARFHRRFVSITGN